MSVTRSVKYAAIAGVGTALALSVQVGSALAQTKSAADAKAASSDKHPTSIGNVPEDTAIRPFHIAVPKAALVDLRKRIAATRWPDRELVADQSQGAKLATIQELVRYWGTDYDWRKAEAKLNALPEFVTRIDGIDIQFVHIKSRHPGAMPLLITHGWPADLRRNWISSGSYMVAMEIAVPSAINKITPLTIWYSGVIFGCGGRI